MIRIDLKSLFTRIAKMVLPPWWTSADAINEAADVAQAPQNMPLPAADSTFAKDEVGGAFYFKRDILDKLDEYFSVLRRFKGADPEAYKLYSNIGAVIVPDDALAASDEIECPDLDDLPAFRCVWMRDDSEQDWLSSSLTYFQKLERCPPNVEPCTGQIFQVSVYFQAIESKGDKRAPKWVQKNGWRMSFHLAVLADRTVRALREVQKDSVSVRTRRSTIDGITNKGKTKGRVISQTHHIPRVYWDYPRGLKMYCEEGARNRFIDVHHAANDLFVLTQNWGMADAAGVRVSASRGGITACFNVDFKRTAYFFRDRETVLNSSGSKAKIFHIVKPHRRLNGETETFVKMHFRGLRKFSWKGYQIVITVPGRHHFSLVDWTAGAVEEGDVDEPVMTMADAGKVIGDVIKGRKAA